MLLLLFVPGPFESAPSGHQLLITSGYSRRHLLKSGYLRNDCFEFEIE